MNILIEIGHPAHVHKLASTIKILKSKNNKIIVITKGIPSVEFLLTKFEIPYKVIGIKKDSLIGKGIMQLWYNLLCFIILKREKIDLIIGSVSASYMTRITNTPSILMDDDDDDAEPLMVKYVHPYITEILSPSALTGTRLRKDTIYYSGYHELAYLHPSVFTPDETVLSELGLQKGEPYFILRFNAFKAHHDVGILGLSIESKRKLINLLETNGKVFITSERNLDEEFEKYKLLLSPEKIHSLIYFATLLIGDSQTMISEAAILGTPAIKCNTFAGKLSIPNELENKYHLCYSFLPEESDLFFIKIEELLNVKDLKLEFLKRKEILLADKINVTSFYVWFIENYPESVNILKENPEFQCSFK
jgi:predicted glycosyltransferase